MLATRSQPFDEDAYFFETNWGGVRAMARGSEGRWRVWGREGVDYTPRHPEPKRPGVRECRDLSRAQRVFLDPLYLRSSARFTVIRLAFEARLAAETLLDGPNPR